MKTRLALTRTSEERETAASDAAQLLAADEVVALPTETVYGLAANALQPNAAAKIFEAKERPFFDPLIVHLPALDWLPRLTLIPDASRTLVEHLIATFWPGPLTLVLPRRDVVPDIVTAGLGTVAVRMSAHPVFRAVIERFGNPLAAPSANRFGRISPTAAEHVRAELGGRIPLIVDGGPTEHGLESTIVKLNADRMELLRAGPITAEELARFGELIVTAQAGAPPDAPGRMKSHYAPRTPLRLRDHRAEALRDSAGAEAGGGTDTSNSPQRTSKVGLLAFATPADTEDFTSIEVLSSTGDLREAAATLFAKLRRLDEAGLDLIFADLLPEHGLGIAIMDRLRKAAAEHAD